jgi:hypothetical protein
MALRQLRAFEARIPVEPGNVQELYLLACSAVRQFVSAELCVNTTEHTSHQLAALAREHASDRSVRALEAFIVSSDRVRFGAWPADETTQRSDLEAAKTAVGVWSEPSSPTMEADRHARP